MPRKTKISSKPSTQEQSNQPYLLPNDSAWGGFINIRLDESQIAAFHSWREDNGKFVAGYFDEMLGAGIKASFSFDAQNQCYICAVTGALVDVTPNSRFCSTSRASSVAEVLALTVWKHVILAKGDYGSYKPSNGSFMSFG